MMMQGRKYSATSSYRYGFNGKENDNEVKGEGNQQDYGMRIYDPRLGRFLSVDPLTAKYPWYTPYQFAGNKPVRFIDLDGSEEASPEERQNAKAYLNNSIRPYVSEQASSRTFRNISPEKFISELESVTLDPSGLAKKASGVGNSCAIYAFSYVYALYEPEKFIEGVASLYITGKAKLREMEIVPDKNLQEIKENGPQSIPTAILGGSLRSSYNGFTNYGSKYWGSTVSSTMKTWLEDRLGVQVSEFSYGPEVVADGITSKDLEKLSAHLNSGKQAVLRVNGEEYNLNSTNKRHLKGDLAGGDHWIVLNGKMNIDETKNEVTFTAFDMNEGLKTKTFKTKIFKDMINHVMMIERKKKENE